jgi:hypothetical protein
MPIYIYKHPETGEIHEVVQGMNDPHVYFGDDEKQSVQWRRVFLKPQATIKTRIDPFSQRDFVEKTGAQTGTLGDLFERSEELSAIRAEKTGGVDPIKEQYFQNYTKRTGKTHMASLPTQIETDQAKVDFGVKPGSIMSSFENDD